VRTLITGGSGFIGTNLVDGLLQHGWEILNVDIQEPVKLEHRGSWLKADILDADVMGNVFDDFQPDTVIHLAARTTTDSNRLDEYVVNTKGTATILDAIRATPSVSKVIITSTQFVHGPDSLPKGDCDYSPHTIYGQSKVVSEELTHRANLTCQWTIVRPTNIWGPWHPRYDKEFWYILKKGLYVHPRTVIRSYGYVGNVVWQIEKILKLPSDDVHGRVFYLGDKPINQIEWVNAFSVAITGHNARLVPSSLMWCLGFLGSSDDFITLSQYDTGLYRAHGSNL
jgi:nucleoside-diphosphate-sugar epimerase